MLALLEIGRTLWKHERELLETRGILERHPDHIDGAMFLYVNASIFVRPWLGVLDNDDQQRLLEAAGLRHEFISAPQITFQALGCGQCVAQLQSPVNALRALCESCGFILEVSSRSFAGLVRDPSAESCS